MEISLVIPSYNKAQTVCQEIKQLHLYLSQIVNSHEIILVIDGDHDNTYAKVVRELQHIKNLSIICLPSNQGKGVAIVSGLARAQGTYICTLDAGGDIDFRYLKLMLQYMELQRADVVIGSKRNSLSIVSYTPLRYLYSMAYQLLNRVLFNLHVKDTQVGFKLFRKEVIDTILPHITIKSFAFDVEMLLVASMLGYGRIIEAPTRISYTFKSTINIRAVTVMVYDTFRIFYRYRMRSALKEKSQQGTVPAKILTQDRTSSWI